ncbi:uncharacterized protein LOC116177126 isoform X2 [Photinus pyralis]|uniref:uncharacterized protein LOC116177126 isoform X2 n=1 Tax=Photinus pyralis TaxID=7054 RepID=UPI0012671CF6|nr:uncharacterized protein LOC116177126 isoform X2 [Photinus pyralis]
MDLERKVEKRRKFVPAKIVKDYNNNNELKIQLVNKLVQVRTEAIPEGAMVTSEVRNEEGRYGTKKYVTKCYFQPKQNPVSYSETVILTLGSNKKHYFDTILYQTKLVPFRWTESVKTATPPQTFYEFQSKYEYALEDPKWQYISLEAQQRAAEEKSHRAQEIKV